MAALASRAEVARLYGRAAFGATAADLERGTTMTYEELVVSLFPPAAADVRSPAPDDADRVKFETDGWDSWVGMLPVIAWWQERMRTGAWPLEERMTLFWHDHFATAFAKPPNSDHMTIQNQLLRIHALGDFRALAKRITIDAAMLHWLDGASSAGEKPNENYAREFLELFTAGAPPPGTATQRYSEQEIRDAARALTGWTVKAPRTVDFDPARHVPKAITLWKRQICSGKRGLTPELDKAEHSGDYARFVDAALTIEGVDRYLAYCLVRGLAYVPDPAVALTGGDPLVERVAAAVRPALGTGRWDVGAAVRTLLTAPEWRGSQPPARQGVRSPVEILVHAAKVLNVDLYVYTEDSPVAGGNVDPTPVKRVVQTLMDTAAGAGQLPFLPPGVGGWPHGAEWFSTMNNLARYEILAAVHDAWQAQARNATGSAVQVDLPPSGDLAAWTAFMGLAALSPTTTAQVRAYLADPDAGTEAARQRGVFILIGTSPDWQVM